MKIKILKKKFSTGKIQYKYLKIFLVISICLFSSCSNKKPDFKYEEIKTKDELTIGLKIIDKNGKVIKIFIYKDGDYPLNGIYECLKEIDLTGDGKKEIVISYFSLGAHCCFEYFILTPKNGKMEEIGHLKFGNAEITEFKNLDRDGIVEIIGYDDRLAYHFLSFADTPFFPRIIHFEKDKFVECTIKYPEFLKKEAKVFEGELKLYTALLKRELGYKLGILDRLRILKRRIINSQRDIDIEGKDKNLFKRVKIIYQDIKKEISCKPGEIDDYSLSNIIQSNALGMLSIYILLGKEREGVNKIEEIVRDIKKPVDVVSWLKDTRVELRDILYMKDRDEIEGFMWGNYMDNLKKTMKEIEEFEKSKEK